MCIRDSPKGQCSGHCQRLIDTRIEELNITRVKPLTLCVPGQSKVRRRRTDLRAQVRPMHELLHEEMYDTYGPRNEMRQALQNTEQPAIYHQHRVVRDSSGDDIVLPCA
eukprot:4031212-Pyramimonas_sp.AAC.1